MPKQKSERDTYYRNFKYEILEKIDLGKIVKDDKGLIRTSKIVYIDNNGREVRASGKGKTVDECTDALVRNFIKKKEQRQNQIHSKTFREIADEWYDRRIIHAKMSGGNRNNYTGILKNHIKPFFNDINIERINQSILQNFLNQYEGKSEAHVKRIRMTLNMILNFAMENEYMPYKPFLCKTHLPAAVPDKIKRPLTEDEIKILLKLCVSDEIITIFPAMLFCGIRPCEMEKGIPFSNIDFEKKTIKIGESKTVNGAGRLIPAPDLLINIIKKDYDEIINKDEKPIWVFHPKTANDSKISSECINNYWEEMVNKAKMMKPDNVNQDNFFLGISPYNLRHTFATILNDVGITDYFRKSLMGHSHDKSDVINVYTHSSEDMVLKMAQKYIDFINQKNKEYGF